MKFSYKHALLQAVNRLLGPTGFALRRAHHAIELGDPASFRLEPRWDEERGHPQLTKIIGDSEALYRETLGAIMERVPELKRIPVTTTDPLCPRWVNGFFPALDAIALYHFIAEHRPARYLEIGSGNSTMFARRAVADHGLSTRITSIDPLPRAEIDSLCDEVIREPLETASLGLFSSLQAGDVLFFDGSHRSFMNSDVTVFFLDVLPRLAPGVLVQIHDIYLPSDYIRRIGTEHWYNEQYLLGAYLLGGGRNVEIILPNYWITSQPRFVDERAALWDGLGFAWRGGDFPESHLGGGSFWMRTRAAGST